jgi:hypothetical protein
MDTELEVSAGVTSGRAGPFQRFAEASASALRFADASAPDIEPRHVEHILTFLERHALLVALDYAFLDGRDPDDIMAEHQEGHRAAEDPAPTAQKSAADTAAAEVQKRKSLALELQRRAWSECRAHGLLDVEDLRDLAQAGTLAEVLPRGMAHSIMREHEREHVARETAAEKALVRRGGGIIVTIGAFLHACVGNEEAMESTSSNYGIIAALMLTMTFGNFDFVSLEDLDAYGSNVALDFCLRYQFADALPCGTDTLIKCTEAVDLQQHDPWTNLTVHTSLYDGTPLACCRPVVDCVTARVLKIEYVEMTVHIVHVRHRIFARFPYDGGHLSRRYWHVFCNGMASVMLLLVVLQAAWLYIALHATKVNRTRHRERALLVRYFRRDFLLLQLMFLLGMILAFFGLGAVATIKTTERRIAYVIEIMTCVGVVLFTGFLLSIVRAVTSLNARIDSERVRAHDDAISCKLSEAGVSAEQKKFLGNAAARAHEEAEKAAV